VQVSVVINTLNRASSLTRTLDSLRLQVFQDFEVVVINGPSTDDTGELLDTWAGSLRIERCPEPRLGLSRNIGIQAAAGDVVAFIDDDAIPEPDWLCSMVEAFEDPRVAGAGGIVWDRTGARLQYRYSVCSRSGITRFDVEPPFDSFLGPGADPFLYLQGTNCSFRRDALAEVGGFDEQIEYMYDEVEVCLRLVDAGYLLKPIAGAAVHHKYRASHMRSDSGRMLSAYPAVKNRARFAFRYGTPAHSEAEMRSLVKAYADSLRSTADSSVANGWMTEQDRARLEAEIARGLHDGTEAGLRECRPSARIPPADRSRFTPFPVKQPEGGRLCVAFVSGEYPPGYFGGIGRFTQDLATGMAGNGHEVHVVTPAAGGYNLDLEDGVWVHRVPVEERMVTGIEASPLRSNWLHLAAYYHEICRIHEHRPLDIVSGPLWNSETLLCTLDDRFPTITSLMTTLRTVADIHPSWETSPNVTGMLRLEARTLASSRFFHAISRAILKDVEAQNGSLPGEAWIVPLGVVDRQLKQLEVHPGVRLLFVGRLERRKGVDLLLEVVPDLLLEYPDLVVQVVGQDTPNTEMGMGYREAFERRYTGSEIGKRVIFSGQVTEEELYKAYAECDIFCAPSRFESLGLVLLEAMMMGKPVVATAVGGMTEVVDGNGLLALPEDAGSLRTCLSRLIGDAGLREEMGKRSRELFESLWSLPLAVERTLEAYREAAARWTQPSGQPVVAARMERILQEIENLSPEAASATAEALLDRSCYPTDILSALRRLWDKPDDEFIEGLYRLVLGRDPDPLGLSLQMNRLRSGGSRTEILEVLTSSGECGRSTEWEKYVQEVREWPPVPFSGRDYPSVISDIWGLRDREFVTQLYRILLGRAPDPGGLDAYCERLARGERRSGVVEAIASSPEASALEIGSEWLSVISGWDAPQDNASIAASASTLLTTALRRSRSAYRGLRNLARLESLLESTAERIVSKSMPGIDATVSDRLVIEAGQAHEQLARLAQRQEELASWVKTLQVKMEALAMDVRDRIPAVVPEASAADPIVPDSSELRRAIDLMDGRVRVNLGCGEKPLPGYINVDSRRLPGVHIVADIRRLPFEPGTLAEVASWHLVEHFRAHHFANVILPYWKSLLRPDGILRIVCPNGEELVRRAAEGRITMAEFRTVMFGLQDYSGDDHLAMYTPDLLRDTLLGAGFRKVDLIAESRQNGLCPEMELVADLAE
jgi:glycogen synthase